MKVYDETKTFELKEYDLENGYLMPEKKSLQIEEVQAIAEVSHLEPIEGHPYCFRKIIDVEKVEYQPARIEEEEIYVYVPYTEEEKAKRSANKKITELKSWFNNEYRIYFEKLTRFTALGIIEQVYDKVRNKYYNNLEELYNEAESVRFEINELEL